MAQLNMGNYRRVKTRLR